MTSPSGRRTCLSVRDWFEASPLRAPFRPLARVVERALGLATLDRLYHDLPKDARPFSARALETLRVGWELVEAEGVEIPRFGPLIVVANHPHGGLDGLVLDSWLRTARPDVKLLGNHLLRRIPELRESCFFVDPFRDARHSPANAATLRAVVRWIREGGALAVFPAGEVSHIAGDDGQILDSPWNTVVAWLIRHTAASVMPVFFAGGNSRAFSLAGRIHPRLRTAMLARELLRQRNRVLQVRVGAAIPPSRFDSLEDDEQVTAYLRIRTYALGAADRPQPHPSARAAENRENIAVPEPPEQLRQEVDALPAARALLRSGPFVVSIARASEIPRTLREIGRLREVTFRQAGEGTSRSRDLDAFDEHYLHLFVWHAERQEIVGAYRVGATDEILPRAGVSGLYTSTLFHYTPPLLEQITPALELGRAFVRPEYQRDYSPLLLLWKGIGAFVAMNPRYRMLFGPVSISNDYQSLSRQILARFLYATSYRSDLAQLVRPRNPAPFLQARHGAHPLLSTVVRNVVEVGALVAEIERDQKGVPVLLRQYLKLNARLLGFNVDPAFGNALDGLMLVDLMDVERSILLRYMGTAGANAFLTYHGGATARQAS